MNIYVPIPIIVIDRSFGLITNTCVLPYKGVTFSQRHDPVCNTYVTERDYHNNVRSSSFIVVGHSAPNLIRIFPFRNFLHFYTLLLLLLFLLLLPLY